MGSWSRELKVAFSIVEDVDGDDDNDGLDMDEDGHDADNDLLNMDEDDNHDDGDTGRALVETEPVRYQLEEIQLTLDKEDSEKVTIPMMMIMMTMPVITMTTILMMTKLGIIQLCVDKKDSERCSSVLMP